jgi:hypothetical protein
MSPTHRRRWFFWCECWLDAFGQQLPFFPSNVTKNHFAGTLFFFVATKCMDEARCFLCSWPFIFAHAHYPSVPFFLSFLAHELYFAHD